MNTINLVNKLVRRHKTHNPFEICSELGIEVVFADLGSLKGMYTCIKRNRFVVVNQNLDYITKKIVCAHELAHDQLHRSIATSSWLKDYDIYTNSSKYEYEANLFVSELLVDENYFIELVNDRKTVLEIAKIMCLDHNLISMKAKLLIDKGYKLNPQDFDSSFLKYDYISNLF